MNPHSGTTILIQPEGVTIPTALDDLRTFRSWTQGPDFPAQGRIDWLAGQVEVDMAPEDINSHGTAKAALSRELGIRVETADRGIVLIDSSRLVSVEADLSCEPDVVVVLFESVDQGRVRLVPRAGGGAGRFVEIEGAADLVVEVVSDSSVQKDTARLPELYHRAGVREYWRVDARGADPSLLVYRHESRGFDASQPDAEGYSRSHVLGAAVRLSRLPPRSGLVRYRLDVRS